MSKVPETSAPIADLIRDRWSPRSFDAAYEISDQDLLSILEAARWAPSANNGQPWRFSVAKRGTELHAQISDGLSGFNRAWAPVASVLIVVSVKKDEDGTSSKRNFFDAGLSVSLLALQAQALGLHSHQMAGIDVEKLQQVLDIPDDLEVALVIAVGKRDEPTKLEGPALERELAPRTRLDLADIVLHGQP